MNNFSEAMKESADEYKKWFNKNKRLIELVGLNWNEASQYKKQINKLKEDINRFNKAIMIGISISILILIVFSIINFKIAQDYIKMSYFIAYYLGFVGSFLVSYGYLLQLKTINRSQNNNKRMFLPKIPRNNTEFNIYATELNKFLTKYINNEFKQNWPRIKIEFRKQKSLFYGFIIISISFLIQIVLQFF